jgi:hypothetical protein
MNIVNVSPGENDQSRLQDTGAADILAGALALCLKNTILFQ